MTQQHPLLAPIYAPGSEPYPPGTTLEEKQEVRKVQNWTKQMNMVMESCPTKVVMAGGMGEYNLGVQAMPNTVFRCRRHFSKQIDRSFPVGHVFSERHRCSMKPRSDVGLRTPALYRNSV